MPSVVHQSAAHEKSLAILASLHRAGRQGISRRTAVMGILNVTPDSFSGDGLANPLSDQQKEQALLEAADAMIQAGADILDIGGESTRPGAQTISTDDECARTIPAIRALRHTWPEQPLSIDTRKAAVAQAAVEAGANWINDVSGFQHDPAMIDVLRHTSVPGVLMHYATGRVRVDAHLGGRYAHSDLILETDAPTTTVVEMVRRQLLETAQWAENKGLIKENILLDPGFGFGKTVAQNLQLLNGLERVADLEYPLLIGTSRKSFIGFTLEAPPDQRLEGTLSTLTIAILKGASIVRVHDVKSAVKVCRMTDAVLNA